MVVCDLRVYQNKIYNITEELLSVNIVITIQMNKSGKPSIAYVFACNDYLVYFPPFFLRFSESKYIQVTSLKHIPTTAEPQPRYGRVYNMFFVNIFCSLYLLY